MSEEQKPKVNLKTVMRRRIKDDQLNRDYKCKCGKGYLSYPALYTHVKNKHPQQLKSMIANGEVQKPPTTVQKRGRPTTISDPRLHANDQVNIEFSALSVLEILTVELVDIFKCMEQFVSQPIILVANNTNFLTDLKTLSEPYKEFMIPEFLREESPEMKAVFENLAINYTHRLCKHFSSYVTVRLYAIMSLLIQGYRQSHPRNHPPAFESDEEGSQDQEAEETIEIGFFNDFVDDVFPKLKNRWKVPLWEEHPEIIDKLLMGFGNWMNVYGYASRVQLRAS